MCIRDRVWLITGGGALFAAFPYVYASVFSGFYLAFLLLLLTLIFRAVSIEFRSKQPMKWWRRGWAVSYTHLDVYKRQAGSSPILLNISWDPTWGWNRLPS